jgi:hypothetical protein
LVFGELVQNFRAYKCPRELHAPSVPWVFLGSVCCYSWLMVSSAHT